MEGATLSFLRIHKSTRNVDIAIVHLIFLAHVEFSHYIVREKSHSKFFITLYSLKHRDENIQKKYIWYYSETNGK
jgi:hypothetical protein